MPEADKIFDVSAHAYAHRGLWSFDVPQNSLSAFRLASDYGVGVELDVRLTADGQPVVFHDATFEELCRDSRRIDETALSELMSVTLPDGSAIPTLDQALDVLANVPVLVELKVDTPGDTRIADVVARVLAPRTGRLAVMSFDEITVARLCRLITERPIGLLIEGCPAIGMGEVIGKAEKARAMGCDYLAPKLSSLEIAARHSCGLPLVTWTVNLSGDLDFARKLGAAPIFEGLSPSLASGLAKPS